MPNTSDLNLEAAGIDTDECGFIKVNSHLEASASDIHALGDIKSGPSFTHISYDDFRISMHKLVSHTTDPLLSIDNRLVPYCCFTDPQRGRVSLTEQQVRAEHDMDDASSRIATATMPMTWVARALEFNETRGTMMALINKETNKILGFVCPSYEGGKVMSALQLGVQCGLTWRQLRDTVFAHPCTAEALNNPFARFGDD